MPWFKTDDKFHDHRKTRRALRSAADKRRDVAPLGLWVAAGTWSSDNLTDGFIPADELDRWDDDGVALAKRLVEAGFWAPATVDGEDGYQFVNWAEHQPTKEEVLAQRERKAAAGRKGGIASGRTRRGKNDGSKTEAPASQVVEPPTRPDPTRPTAAAAAVDDPRGSGSVLPGDVDVLRSRMATHTALAGLRWDKASPDQLERISALIAKHGDAVLVDWALRTCRATPPVHATAFLGTWEAIGAPRVVEATQPQQVCDICGQPRRSCERAAATVPEDDRHRFQTRTA